MLYAELSQSDVSAETLFGVDVNASRTISSVGVAAAGTARSIESMGTHTLKATALAGALGVAVSGLSVAAVGAAGAVGVGLGGAILGLGVAAALLNTQLKQTFKDTGAAIKKEIAGINGPVVASLSKVAVSVRQTFAGVRPELAGLFKQMAPVFGNLGKGLTDSIRLIAQAIGPLFATLTPIINVFAANLAPLLGSLVGMLHNMLAPLAANVGAFQGFLVMVEQLLPVVGMLVGSLVTLGAQVLPLFEPLLRILVGALTPLLAAFGRLGAQILPTLTGVLGPLLTQLSGGLGRVLPVVGQAIITMLPPLGQLVSVLLRAAEQVLPVLLPLLAQLVSALAGALAKALPQILPSLVAIVQAVASLLPAVTPLLPSLVYLATSVSNLLVPLAKLAAQILVALLPGIQALLPYVVKLTNLIGTGLAKALAAASPPLVSLATAIAKAIPWVIGFVRNLIDTARHSQRLHHVVQTVAEFFVRTFTPTVNALAHAFTVNVLPALKRLWEMVQRNRPAIESVTKAVGKFIVGVDALWLKLAGFLLPILIRVGGFLIGKLVDFIARTTHYIGDMIHAVANTVHAFENMIHAGGNVVHAFGNVIHAIDNVIHAGGNIVHAIGNVVHALGNIVHAGQDVVGWLNRLPGTIIRIFAKAGSWLFNAGKDVLIGFWNGLKQVWKNVTGWIGGLGGWIKAHKGPESLDRNLLFNAGHLIMDGFYRGLKAGGLKAYGFVKSVAGDIGRAVLGGVPTGINAMQSMVKGYAQQFFGWGGGQWTALYNLLMRESGFSPSAQNPTSTAYGMFQFLDSTWAAMGVGKTSNPNVQTMAGLQYIKQRYGTPADAWNHEMMFGWYGSGLAPTVFSRPTLIGVGERGAETVSVTPGRGGTGAQARAYQAGAGGRGGGPSAGGELLPVTINIDGRAVWQGLLTVKRQNGGRALGLA